jgi:hypothetical protein
MSDLVRVSNSTPALPMELDKIPGCDQAGILWFIASVGWESNRKESEYNTFRLSSLN